MSECAGRAVGLRKDQSLRDGVGEPNIHWAKLGLGPSHAGEVVADSRACKPLRD